jgi:hypothetical protein
MSLLMTRAPRFVWFGVRAASLAGMAIAAACGASATPGSGDTVATQPIYSYYSGRLEQLKADVDGNGTMETVAYMDGTRLERIEIDRTGDGKPDRWEYYKAGNPALAATGGNPFDRWALIDRADESAAADGHVTRSEFYENGRIQRVDEDTDLDGHIDKWEYYDASGTLAHVDLDLEHAGHATRRLVYAATGEVTRIEADPDGDGVFAAAPPAR